MDRRLAVAILIFINVLWGSSYGITKVVLAEIPPVLFGALRWIIGAFLLWSIQLWLWSRQPKGSKSAMASVSSEDRLRLMSLGVFSMGIAFILAYNGINLTTATDASLMISAEVFFTSLLAAWVAHEALGRVKFFGMLLGAAGVTILVLGHLTGAGGESNGWNRTLGDLLILINLAMQAVYTVFGTGLARKYPPLTMLTFVCTGSLLVWIPILLWYLFSGNFPHALSLRALSGLIYLSVVTSIICNFIWFSISTRLGAGLTAISLFAQPLVGSLIGLLFLNEPLTVSLIVGATLVFVALYLITIAPLTASKSVEVRPASLPLTDI